CDAEGIRRPTPLVQGLAQTLPSLKGWRKNRVVDGCPSALGLDRRVSDARRRPHPATTDRPHPTARRPTGRTHTAQGQVGRRATDAPREGFTDGQPVPSMKSRSEERRVGKEWRRRLSPDHQKRSWVTIE